LFEGVVNEDGALCIFCCSLCIVSDCDVRGFDSGLRNTQTESIAYSYPHIYLHFNKKQVVLNQLLSVFCGEKNKI
jgi:hypothetical protein